ncbi:hypothetical protein NDU88_005497 [Pleurodeles waltl]|uniref:Uncharacterized protein n=1 Tax=Pleurodeles waltl TaxID=8319 RepID=A0AAV7L472_PLEWA|nr:hypothetical protein NDU88_005497 [Pleurodeles waltl]
MSNEASSLTVFFVRLSASAGQRTDEAITRRPATWARAMRRLSAPVAGNVRRQGARGPGAPRARDLRRERVK